MTEKDIGVIIAMHNRRMPYKKIAEIIRWSYVDVYRAANNGRYPKGHRPKDLPKCLLEPDIVVQSINPAKLLIVKRDHADGVAITAIARKYGLTEQAVKQVVNI